MKTKSKERRVVNLDKVSFDIIKKHCDSNSLDMPKWIAKSILEKIQLQKSTLMCRLKLTTDPISLVILSADGYAHKTLDGIGNDGRVNVELTTQKEK